MKRILGVRNIIDLTLAVMLIGGVVFSLGFGISLYIAREEVKREANLTVEADIDYMRAYVDGQLQRVEDAAYTLLCTQFGNTVRDAQGNCHVEIDPKRYNKPSIEEINALLSQFLDANPHVCGIAIGFEPDVYPNMSSTYGMASYITNVGGGKDTLNLGAIHDYRLRTWYSNAATSNRSTWSSPFRETSIGKVVTCFSVPLHGTDGRLIGVLGIDIDNEAFRNKCKEVAPYPRSEVAMLDSNFHFVAHSNPDFDLKSIDEVIDYDAYNFFDETCLQAFRNHESGHFEIDRIGDNDALFYFTPINRTGWTITIECPNNEIMDSITSMKRKTTTIAIVSILFMIVCFVWLFNRMQGVALAKASIDGELKIASGIQLDMLPKGYPAFPERDDIDVCGYICPAKSVGGDIYDYFIRDDKLYFAIGDVSGKGVPAALFMAVIHALIRNVTQHMSDPAHIIMALNDALAERNDHNMFCTMFIGVLDLNKGKLDYCNAGHCAPLLMLKNGDVHPLDVAVNIALGVIEKFPYKGQTYSMQGGDGIFLYTDGVSEAENHEKVLYGDKAIVKSLRFNPNSPNDTKLNASGVIEMVINDLSKHVEDADQSDDITMLMVQFNKHQENEVCLHLTNDVVEVSQLTQWLENVGETFDVAQEQMFNINLAVEEAVVNVMSYAYGEKTRMPIDIVARKLTDGLEITISDHGCAFDPTQVDAPDLTLSVEERPIGGLGIMLVRKLTRSVAYKREDDCNILTLVF